MMLARVSIVNEAQEREDLIIKTHKSIVAKIDGFVRAHDREDEDSLENREIDMCFDMFIAGLIYYDQKFSGHYNTLLRNMRLQFNRFVNIIPNETASRLNPFLELYNEILQKPLGNFMIINSNNSDSVKVKKLISQEIVKKFLIEVFKKRRQQQRLNSFIGAVLIMRHLTSN